MNQGDLFRQVQPGAGLDMPAGRIMRGPLFASRNQGLPFHPIARMRLVGVQQPPVPDRQGRVGGDLTLEAVLAAPMERLLSLVDQLSRGNMPQELRGVKGSQAAMARILPEDGLPTTEMQAVLTEVNNDPYTRIVGFELERLVDEGILLNA